MAHSTRRINKSDGNRAGALALLLLLGAGAARAAQSDATTSAAFLKVPIGARNAAMGATGAAEVSAYSIYWNPAGLEALRLREAAYSYTSWLQDTGFHFVGYGQKTSYGAFGGSVQYASAAPIQKFDNTGAALAEQYAPFNGLATLSYARRLAALAVGATVKAVYSRLDDRTANTAAFDAGARYDVVLGGRLSLGLAVQNMGPGLKYVSDRAPLPLNVKAGASYEVFDGVTLCADVNQARAAQAWFGLGAEFMARVAPGVRAGPRAGYESDRRALGGLAGMTTGVGLSFEKFSFDYAFVPMGDFGDAHRLSMAVRF